MKSMVITDREPDYEIDVSGVRVYDSHENGALPDDEVIAKVVEALGVEVKESDWLREPGDEDLHFTAKLLRIAAAHEVRTWVLDRAPYDDDKALPTP